MDFIESIKMRKKDMGMTNEALAEASGISLGTLNKLLCGATTDPKLSTLLPLARVFCCSLDELLGTENDTLPPDLAKEYAALDTSGRTAVADTIYKERERMTRARAESVRRLKLFNIAVSAGTGSYLSGDEYSEITVYVNEKTDAADFAVRVYGDSMMPRYESGDILLVSRTDTVNEGELGIFSLGGESYFKKFGGDRLISLNPAYRDIPIRERDEILCFGRVIGRLKKQA